MSVEEDRQLMEEAYAPEWWWHEAHGLHDEEHHQHHDPMHLCVPLYVHPRSGYQASLAARLAAVLDERDRLVSAVQARDWENGEVRALLDRAVDRLADAKGRIPYSHLLDIREPLVEASHRLAALSAARPEGRQAPE